MSRTSFSWVGLPNAVFTGWFILASFVAAGVLERSNWAVGPPVIRRRPQSQSVVVGADRDLAIEATRGAPLIYQSPSNRMELAGATHVILTPSPVPVNPTGADTMILSRPERAGTSQAFRLSANPVGAPLARINGQTLPMFSFTNVSSVQVDWVTSFTNATIFYTLDGSPPGLASTLYRLPLIITQSVVLRAIAYAADFTSAEAKPVPINFWRGFSLTVTHLGQGTVTVEPRADLYLSDTVVTLTAVPAEGWSFLEWSGNASGTNNPLRLAMEKAKTITANFISPTISISVRGQGTVARAPDKAHYDLGEAVVLTAQPGRYFAFEQWGDGRTENPRTIRIGTNNHYAVVFTNTNVAPLEERVSKQWDKTFGGVGLDEFITIQPTSDRGYLLVGYSFSGMGGNKSSSGWGNYDCWVVKMDADGNKDWDRSYGGASAERPVAILSTGDGGHLLGCISKSGISGNKTTPAFGERYDYWVIKIDAQGNPEWDQTFGGNFEDTLVTMTPASDGGYLLGGHSRSDASGNKSSPGFLTYDFWVVKIDAQGHKEWDRSYGGYGDDWLETIQPTLDGGYLLGGTSNSHISGNKTGSYFGGSQIEEYNRVWHPFDRGFPSSRAWGFSGNFVWGDYWVVKIDAQGNKQWDKSFGGNSGDYLISLLPASNGGYLLAGNSFSAVSGTKTSESYGNCDFWVVKIDDGGIAEWDRSYGGNDEEGLMTVQATSDGGYLLGGRSKSNQISGNKTTIGYNDFPYSDCWVVKVDAEGNTLWDQTLGGRGEDVPVAIQPCPDGDYLLAGYSGSNISGNKTAPTFAYSWFAINYDYWLVKLDASGHRLWDQAFGGGNYDYLSAIQAVPGGGYLLAGVSQTPSVSGNKTTPGFGGTSGDYWVVKLGIDLFQRGEPIVRVNSRVGLELNFTNAAVVQVQLETSFPNGRQFYTLDGSSPNSATTPYHGPFSLSQTALIRAIAYNDTLTKSAEADPVRVNLWNSYWLKASSGGGGRIAVNPVLDLYPSNSVVNVSAIPDPGWNFLSWTGQTEASNAAMALMMDQNRTVQALFGTKVTATVSGNGTIQRNPNLELYPYGTALQLAALPAAGSFFGLWGGDGTGNANPLTLTITQTNPSIAALFAPLNAGQVALTAMANGRGHIRANPPGNVFTRGQSVTLTASAEGHFPFLGWSGAYTGAQNPLTLTLDDSKVITANFPGGDPSSLGPVVYLDQPFGSAQGTFGFNLTTGQRSHFVIQVSTNLVSWTDLITVTNAQGVIPFEDRNTGPFKRRFYKVRSVARPD